MKENDKNSKHFPPKGESRDTFESNRFEDDTLHRVHSQLMREKEEPTEAFSPMPLAFVALFMILAFWAGIYMAEYNGGFSPYVYDPSEKPGEKAEDAGPKKIDMAALGRRVYSQNCVACHQSSGLGVPNVYPPLVNSDWVQDDPHRLINVVLAGLQGQVVVNGNTYNNAMTPFAKLSDREIAAVLTYIRTDPDYNNSVPAVPVEMVEEVRAEYGARTEQWTQQELDAIYGPVGSWEPPAEEPAAEEETEEGGEEAEEGSEEAAASEETAEPDANEG